MPDSVLMPAPVRTTSCRASARWRAAVATARGSSVLSSIGGTLADTFRDGTPPGCRAHRGSGEDASQIRGRPLVNAWRRALARAGDVEHAGCVLRDPPANVRAESGRERVDDQQRLRVLD